MKNIPKKMIIAGVIATAVLASSISTYASINDTDLKKYILEQIQSEETLTATELKEIEADLEGINKKDILEELQEEIADLNDELIKKELTEKITLLGKIEDVADFFQKTEAVYEKLDELYEGDETEDDYISFEEDKKEIFEGLQAELRYADMEDVKKQISESIETLRGLETVDEDSFYDALDREYEKIDTLYDIDYGDEDMENYDDEAFDFEDMKLEILEEVQEEISYIQDEGLKTKLQSYIAVLEKTEDEDELFSTLDDIYENEELDTYYEANEINMYGDEASDDIDFEEERSEILEEITEELAEIDDEAIKKSVDAIIKALDGETTPVKFFKNVDVVYEIMDEYYNTQEDLEDESDDEDMSEEFEKDTI